MPEPIPGWQCRWCRGSRGAVVVDLGTQPAADHFPLPDDPEPDPVYPLRMVLCRSCGLAQLEDDTTSATEARGLEPAAVAVQARLAVADLDAAGHVSPGAIVTELPSPHGGSWLGLLADRELLPAEPGERSDLVVDTLGMMHEEDQRAALARRAALLAPDGVFAVHVHTLGTIVRDGTWNALRHGHYAYYSVPVLVRMAAETGLVPIGAWEYELYGGTVVLAFARAGSAPVARAESSAAAERVGEIVRRETAQGVTDAPVVARLGDAVERSATDIRHYLDTQRAAGHRVAGYGAASRAVALLEVSGVRREDLVAICDASPAKHGRTLPGSRLPVVGLDELAADPPDRVLLFVPDLLDEVRAALPQIEGTGGRWVVAEPELHEVAVQVPDA